MEVHQTTITYSSRADVFRVVPVGDIHAGLRACDESLLDNTIADIKADPLARWVGMGDWGDFINLHDPRFDWGSLAPWVLKKMGSPPISGAAKRAASMTISGIQRDWLLEKFEPIKAKGLGMLYGNHEDAVRVRFEDETAVAMADRLSLPCLGYSCYLRLLFSRLGEQSSTQELVLFLHHGWFTSRLAGGVALNLERLFREHVTAQVIIVAHGHKRSMVDGASYVINWKAKPDKQILERKRYAVMTGPFGRVYSQPGEMAQWTERKGFPLGQRGPVIVTFAPDKQDLHVVM